MGNRGLEELTCTTNGHALGAGNAEELGGGRAEEGQGENQENCSSIINKNI